MKIRKSKLKTIIAEEIQGMLLDEDWKEKLAPVGSFLKTAGKHFMKGFMGKDDNFLSQGAYKAYGETRVKKIDQIFEELIHEFKELQTHDESKKIKAKNLEPDALGSPRGTSGPAVIDYLMETLHGSVIQPWVGATMAFRGTGSPFGAGDGPKHVPGTSSEEDPGTYDVDYGEEEEEGGIAEVIRRQIRKELKKRSTF